MSNALSIFSPQFIRLVKAFACGLALVLMLAAPGMGRDDIPELPAPDGSSDTPEMIVPMIDKTEMKLSSLRGRVVILDFFQYTCPHCQEHAPHMVELYNQYSKRGLVILGLAAHPEDARDNVKAFIKEYKLPYPVGFITTELVAYYTDSHNHGVPQMVLFGPDGKMAKRLIGWTESVGKEMSSAVAQQMAKLQTVKPGSKAGRRTSTRRIVRV
jgi:peroxiredoxin